MNKCFFSANFLRDFTFWLSVSASASVVVFLFPDIPHILLVTLILSPIAVFLLASPALFFTLCCMWVATKVLKPSFRPKITGAVVALLVMAMPPYFLNSAQDRDVQDLTADDEIEAPQLPLFENIALLYRPVSLVHRDELPCDGLCMRLLLNGAAKTVLVNNQQTSNAIVFEDNVDAFHLENRSVCPMAKLPKWSDFDEPNPYGKRQLSVEQRMQIAISQGRCLIHAKAALGKADLVLRQDRLSESANAFEARHDLWTKTISAERISVHTKSATGYNEIYRKTAVRQFRLPPLLFPTSVEAKINMPFAPIVSGIGFPRYKVDWNNRDDMFLTLISMFDLVKAIHLDIELPGE